MPAAAKVMPAKARGKLRPEKKQAASRPTPATSSAGQTSVRRRSVRSEMYETVSMQQTAKAYGSAVSRPVEVMLRGSSA